MNTQHLKYAVEVERTGSITQAADNLCMAQPNLSKAIKELEETLGITIFKRTSKGMIPTERGAEFLVYAKNILAQISEMESLYRRDDGVKQHFNIVIPRGSYISTAITRFVAELDPALEIDVDIKETNSIQAISDVACGDYNLGIIRYQVSHERYFLDFLQSKDLAFDPIWEFEYLAWCPRSHPLAATGIFLRRLEGLHRNRPRGSRRSVTLRTGAQKGGQRASTSRKKSTSTSAAASSTCSPRSRRHTCGCLRYRKSG